MRRRAGPRGESGWALLTVTLWALTAASLVLILAAATLVLGNENGRKELDPRTLPPDTRHAYELAVDNRELFVHLPCYCGCAVLARPHQSLQDCFLEAGGGFSTHASSCSTCVDIALAAERAMNEGLDHAQTASLIDEQFAGRGPRTATGLP